MTQKLSPIICDGCGKDITTTGNSVDYRLSLDTYTPMSGSTSGAVTLMMIYPAIDATKHFCNNLECVKAWLDKLLEGK